MPLMPSEPRSLTKSSAQSLRGHQRHRELQVQRRAQVARRRIVGSRHEGRSTTCKIGSDVRVIRVRETTTDGWRAGTRAVRSKVKHASTQWCRGRSASVRHDDHRHECCRWRNEHAECTSPRSWRSPRNETSSKRCRQDTPLTDQRRGLLSALCSPEKQRTSSLGLFQDGGVAELRHKALVAST